MSPTWKLSQDFLLTQLHLKNIDMLKMFQQIKQLGFPAMLILHCLFILNYLLFKFIIFFICYLFLYVKLHFVCRNCVFLMFYQIKILKPFSLFHIHVSFYFLNLVYLFHDTFLIEDSSYLRFFTLCTK